MKQIPGAMYTVHGKLCRKCGDPSDPFGSIALRHTVCAACYINTLAGRARGILAMISFGRSDERDTEIILGLLEGRSQRDVGAIVGVTQQAVSARLKKMQNIPGI